MYGARDEAVPAIPPFEIVLRGFDRQQVMDHLGALKARVATLGAERDTALQRAADLSEQLEHQRRETAEAATELDRLRREAAEAATEVDRLQQSPLTGASARIQRIMQMAVDEATELQTSAEKETTSLRESTRAEVGQLWRDTREKCERMEAESKSRCQAAEAESEAQRRQAELDFERRRLTAEQQYAQDTARREAETDAWVRDYQTGSVTALHLLMRMAGEQLSGRMLEVEQQVAALRRLRADIADQVSAVHQLLVDAVDLVGQPTAAERDEEVEYAEQADLKTGDYGEASELPESAHSPVPAGGASLSGGGQATRQWARPTLDGWSDQADQSTAKFGLHP